MDWGTQKLSQHRLSQTRASFLMGSIGQFIASAGCIPLGIFALLMPAAAIYSISKSLNFSAIFAGAFMLQSMGFYGLWRLHGSRLNASAFICGITASFLFLASSFVADSALDVCFRIGSPHCYRAVPGNAWLFIFLSYVSLGIALIVQGSSLLNTRHLRLETDDMYSVGILYMTAGVFFSSMLPVFVGGFFVLAVALTFGGYAFMRLRRFHAGGGHVVRTQAA